MNNHELEGYIQREIAGADAKVSLLVRDVGTGEALHAHDADAAVSSASTIKVPVLLAALEKVMRGELSLGSMIKVPKIEILDDTEVFDGILNFQVPTPLVNAVGVDSRGDAAGAAGGMSGADHLYPLHELLYWMIVSSDNTATNVLMSLLGFDAVNAFIRSLGLSRTVLARRMLDFEALRAGRNNLTSAADMAVLFEAVCRESILTPELCRCALGILQRQRSTDMFLRYISDDVAVAHKTGGLDPDLGHDRVAHDAGVFLLGNIRYYLGIFITGAPDDERYAKRLIGRLAKAVYDCYKG